MAYDPKTGWTATFEGVVAATLTPLGDGGELRLDLVPVVADFLLGGGASALMVGGTTSEFITLEMAERRDLLEAFVQAVDGRAPVIAHVGHVDRHGAASLAEHAQDVGADGTTAISPYYHRVTEPACREYFAMLAVAAPDLPFFVYNYPDTTGNTVSFELFQSLLEIPNVAGAKHSVGTFEELEPYLSVAPHVCVMAGNDMLAQRFLGAGGRAIVSGNAAVFPEVVSNLVDAVRQGRDEEADHLMAKLATIVELGRSGAPDRLRELLTMRGIDIGRSRLATFLPGDVPATHATRARDLLQELGD